MDLNKIYMSIDQVNTGFRYKRTETDTLLLSIYARLRDNGHAEVTVLDREDTDVYVQAAYDSHQGHGDLLIKRKYI